MENQKEIVKAVVKVMMDNKGMPFKAALKQVMPDPKPKVILRKKGAK